MSALPDFGRSKTLGAERFIGCVRVGLQSPYLREQIASCPSQTVKQGPLVLRDSVMVEELGEAEVGDFDMTRNVQHDVLRFDVAMNNAKGV